MLRRAVALAYTHCLQKRRHVGQSGGSWSIKTVVPSVKVCLAAAQKCVTDSLQSLAQPALLELGPLC